MIFITKSLAIFKTLNSQIEDLILKINFNIKLTLLTSNKEGLLPCTGELKFLSYYCLIWTLAYQIQIVESFCDINFDQFEEC
ncbi:unnamed protein product [Blepharisma stoltei]|uniref:Uncharacterized protein n=1 Tax=Blepharisma stoltei TaxID=1481888 RepID=A0AAU9IDI6_9CILI|nr:unnamed protein product [Blepharisma stoltei]